MEAGSGDPMTRPTRTLCESTLAALARDTLPEDYLTHEDAVVVEGSTLAVLTVHYTARGGLPLEARLVFGLDNRLLMAFALVPSTFRGALEEGFDLGQAEVLATRRLGSLEDVVAYLRGKGYGLHE